MSRDSFSAQARQMLKRAFPPVKRLQRVYDGILRPRTGVSSPKVACAPGQPKKERGKKLPGYGRDVFERFCAQAVIKIQKARSDRFERKLELATSFLPTCIRRLAVLPFWANKKKDSITYKMAKETLTSPQYPEGIPLREIITFRHFQAWLESKHRSNPRRTNLAQRTLFGVAHGLP